MIYQVSDSEVPGIEDYLTALRRRWKVALVVLLLSLLVSWIFLSTRSSNYSAESRVLVGPTPVGATIDGRLNPPVLEREREVAASINIADQVAALGVVDQTGRDLLQSLSVTFEPDTDTLVVEFSDESPQSAARVSEAFALLYVEQRRAAADALYAIELGSLEDGLAAAEAEVEVIEAEIEALGRERGDLLAVAEPANSGAVTIIDNQLAAKRNELNQAVGTRRGLVSAIREIEADRDTAAPVAELLSAASPPSQPDGLRPSIVWLLAVIVGGGFGLAGAFLADRLDSTMRDRFELERSLGSPVLASVPSLGWRVRFSGDSLVMASSKQSRKLSVAREAFRRLRSSVGFIQSNTSAKAFIVTSARPGEGKTTVTSNLAIAFAQSGRRVGLVSGDLRRPRLDELMSSVGQPGLADLLAGNDDVEFVDGPVKNLWVLPSGQIPGNPAELLSTERALASVNAIADNFDLVLIDTPPVLATADAATLASHGLPVLLVVDGHTTDVAALTVVRSELEKVGAQISGAVLNRDPSSRPSLWPFGRNQDYYPSSQP